MHTHLHGLLNTLTQAKWGREGARKHTGGATFGNIGEEEEVHNGEQKIILEQLFLFSLDSKSCKLKLTPPALCLFGRSQRGQRCRSSTVISSFLDALGGALNASWPSALTLKGYGI